MTVKPLLIAVAVGAMALAAPSAHAGERMTGDQKLAKLLEGRVAGEPASCINTYANRESQTIEGTAIVYGRGRTIWVNRTVHPESLDRWDSLLVRQYGSRLCRQDIVTTFDASSGMYTGNVFLTDFVPYTRVD